MTLPNRLLYDPNTSADELSLLRVAKADSMSDESRRRILAAVGIGAGTLAAPSSATGANGGDSAGQVGLRPGAKLTLGIAGTSVIILALGLLATTVEPLAPAAPATPARDEVSAVELREAPVQQASSSNSTDPHFVQPPAVEQLKQDSVRPETTANTPAKSTAPPTLAEELLALKLARLRLQRNDNAGTLAALTDFWNRFPQARLAQEARVVEIEALVKLGQREKARRLAEPFLNGSSGAASPYAARIRSLLP